MIHPTMRIALGIKIQLSMFIRLQVTLVMMVILHRNDAMATILDTIRPGCLSDGRKHQRKNHKQTYKKTFHARHYKIGLDNMQHLLRKNEG